MTDTAEQVLMIETRVARIISRVTPWARHWAAKYNGHVYLTGSVLHNPAPRDIDIRIVITDDTEFGARYGMEMRDTTIPGRTKAIAWELEGPTQRWVDDLSKVCGRVSQLLQENMDIQIWPGSYWRDDTYPKPIRLAGQQPHWFIYTVHCPDPTAALKDGAAE